MVLLPNRAHPSVVRLYRLLELNSWSTRGRGGAVYLAIVMVYGDITVAVPEIITIPFHSLNLLTLLAR